MRRLARAQHRLLIGVLPHVDALNSNDRDHKVMMIHNIIYLGITSKGMSYSSKRRSAVTGQLFSLKPGTPYQVGH